MSRALGRWIVLGVLGAIVAGLVIFTNLSNKRLVSGLQSGDADALSAFAERQDAYIFLQSESPDVRLRVAKGLAGWKDDAAAKLILKLIPDPDPGVRAALIDSLQAAAARNPTPVAAEFSAGEAAQSAALIEASSRDVEVGLSILKAVLAQNPGSVNGTLLAKRLGSRSEPVLIQLLNHNDAGCSGFHLLPSCRAIRNCRPRRTPQRAERHRLRPQFGQDWSWRFPRCMH